jgi:hypothetical protein
VFCYMAGWQGRVCVGKIRRSGRQVVCRGLRTTAPHTTRQPKLVIHQTWTRNACSSQSSLQHYRQGSRSKSFSQKRMSYRREESKLFPCLDKIAREMNTNSLILVSFTMVTLKKFQIWEETRVSDCGILGCDTVCSYSWKHVIMLHASSLKMELV